LKEYLLDLLREVMVGENYYKENKEDISFKTSVLFALKILSA